MRQAQTAEESWEPQLIRDITPLEDIDDESVFMISCQENEADMRELPREGSIEIEGTAMLALINQGPQ